jgi:hypothetical protein
MCRPPGPRRSRRYVKDGTRPAVQCGEQLGQPVDRLVSGHDHGGPHRAAGELALESEGQTLHVGTGLAARRFRQQGDPATQFGDAARVQQQEFAILNRSRGPPGAGMNLSRFDV